MERDSDSNKGGRDTLEKMVDGMQADRTVESDKRLIGEVRKSALVSGPGNVAETAPAPNQRKTTEKTNIFGGRRNSARGSDGGHRSRTERAHYQAEEEAFENAVSESYKGRDWQTLESMAIQRLEASAQRPSVKGFFYLGVAQYKQE